MDNKVVIFDLGNVLVKVENSRVLPILKQYITDPKLHPETERIFYYTPMEVTEEGSFERLHSDLHKGVITLQNFYDYLKAKLPLRDDFTYDVFMRIWPARFRLMENVLKIVKSLNHYHRFLLSDTNEADAQWIGKHYGDIYRQFDRIFFSFETKTDKFSLDTWKNIIQVTGLPPAQHVYIDDNRGHVERARTLGIRGIVFRNSEQLQTELANIGFRFG